MRSSNALHSRGLGTTWVHSENGRLVVTIYGGLFSPFGDDLEQKFGTYFGQRHIANLIERNQIVAGPTR